MVGVVVQMRAGGRVGTADDDPLALLTGLPDQIKAVALLGHQFRPVRITSKESRIGIVPRLDVAVDEGELPVGGEEGGDGARAPGAPRDTERRPARRSPGSSRMKRAEFRIDKQGAGHPSPS